MVPENIRLNSMHDCIMKIPSRQELPQIALNHLSDIDFKDFVNLYQKCTAQPYYFLISDATLASDNPSSFKKNLLKIM